MAILNILLVMSQTYIDMFNTYYDKTRINIVGQTSRVTEGTNLIFRHKNCITVLEDTLSTPDIIHKLHQHHTPFLVVCKDSKIGFSFLEKGAINMMVKPKSSNPIREKTFVHLLCMKIKNVPETLEQEKNRILKYKGPGRSDKVIAIGSSTGGTESVMQILQTMPPDAPPILVVQHLPPVFTKMYAQQLNAACKISVWEARDNDELHTGLALIAPGNLQMCLKKQQGKLFVSCKDDKKYGGHCPSVDVLFYSVAEAMGQKAIGVILTGMGSDGARGLLEMRNQGAFTIGQNKESCVIYGMPRAAYEMGAVCQQEHLKNISRVILDHI